MNGSPTLVARFLVIALVLCLGGASGVVAQEPSDQERFQRAFEEGLSLLQDGEHEEAIERFEQCIDLFPARPTAYYNIACAHSLAGRTDEAVSWLERSMERGFHDLVHVARDPDLDPLRELASFREAVAALREEIAAGMEVEVRSPDGGAPDDVVVILHPAGRTPAGFLRAHPDLADRLGATVLVPAGDRRVRDARAWSGAGAGALLDRLAGEEAFADASPGNAYVLGLGRSGPRALDAVLVGGPDRVRGVAVLGGTFGERPPGPELERAAAADLSVYLLHGGYGGAGLARARAVRDVLDRASVRSILRRPPAGEDAPRHPVEAMDEALDWLRGGSRGPETF